MIPKLLPTNFVTVLGAAMCDLISASAERFSGIDFSNCNKEFTCRFWSAFQTVVKTSN